MKQLRDALAGPLESVVEAWPTLALLLVTIVLVRLAGALVERSLSRVWAPERAALLRRVLVWGVALFLLAAALDAVGFDVGVLLGAAGVITVALGFASQTSASNVISGLFLVWERPFSVGDVVDLDGTVGEVLAVDWMSVSLRTFDNRYVRVPNELMMKSAIKNLSRFPIRRVDYVIPVALEEDLDRVRTLLMETALAHPLVLEDPPPACWLEEFREGRVLLFLGPWTARENYVAVKDEVGRALHRALREHHVRLPAWPHAEPT